MHRDYVGEMRELRFLGYFLLLLVLGLVPLLSILAILLTPLMWIGVIILICCIGELVYGLWPGPKYYMSLWDAAKEHVVYVVTGRLD